MKKLLTSFLILSQLYLQANYLETLPEGFLPYEEFSKEFQLAGTTTEQLNSLTKKLSQTTHKSISEGMQLLLDVDETVVTGYIESIPKIKTFGSLFAEQIKNGGRIFLVGSGSSGRVGVNLASKCYQAFPKSRNQVIGVIAGGDSTIIRPKEGFEDSESDGKKALQDYNLGINDCVILISASGSAPFNVGCGHFAADQGAKVVYFYNSKDIPSRTQNLFNREKNPVLPFCIDIGPQAIAGSTRLQGATLAKACLGALLADVLYLNSGREDLAKTYLQELSTKMAEGIQILRNHVGDLANFAQKEKEIFSSPQSNFRQLRDVTDQGYVTFISLGDSIFEILIDSTETSPTFSTNFILRESEKNKKRAEFRSYIVQESEKVAWEAVLGRSVNVQDVNDTSDFLLSTKTAGLYSYQNRPRGNGNFLIAVSKLQKEQKVSSSLLEELAQAKKLGGQTGVLIVTRDKLRENQQQDLKNHITCIIDNVPSDALGLVETIVLKQALNLVSNSSMILMNKIHGNQMIDVRAANKKLIGRCLRLIKEIWSESHASTPCSDQDLYHCIAHVQGLKKFYSEKGLYTPSLVKIVLAMLAMKKDPNHFQEVVDLLQEKQERIDWIGELR